MSYKELYDFCQTQKPIYTKNIIRDKVLSLTGHASVRTVKTTMDIKVQRGFFLSAQNSDHPFVKQVGTNVIVLARGMNKCWDRFVYTKELMHFFDIEDEQTGSAEAFEKNIEDLIMNSNGICAQAKAEYKCFWRALGALCPEEFRLKLKDQRDKKHIDDYSIALLLKIPTQHVKWLMHDNFPDFINECFS